MRDKEGSLIRFCGSILIIVALMVLYQPLHSQMVNKGEKIKSTITLLWLFQEVSSTEYFFVIKESLYEPTLMLEEWMFDLENFSKTDCSETSLLYEDVFYEPELKFEDWMIDLKCFCKYLPEKFCDEILDLEDWMCCPFKIK